MTHEFSEQVMRSSKKLG